MPLFPVKLFSPAVQVFTVACPLSADAKAELASAHFAFPEGLLRAVASRKDEYAAGRYCAWLALGRSAIPGTGPDRAPRWPSGLVGSIAHAHGIAVAAVTSTAHCLALGVDLEPCMSLERAASVRPRLLTAADERIVAGLVGWGEGDQVTLVFSAKEAIYKGLHPLCGQFFGFHDAELTAVNEAAGTFGFKLLRELPGGFAAGWTAEGRFAREDGWVFTAIEIAASHLPRH